MCVAFTNVARNCTINPIPLHLLYSIFPNEIDSISVVHFLPYTCSKIVEFLELYKNNNIHTEIVSPIYQSGVVPAENHVQKLPKINKGNIF